MHVTDTPPESQLGWYEKPDGTDLATWAWFYSQVLGWPIFPVAPNGKTPLSDAKNGIGHNGVKGASTDPDRVIWWWWLHPDANIGLACGDLVVIDLDGEDGLVNYRDLFGDSYPSTPVALTGGGGAHVFHRVPEHREARNSASKLAENIDTRGKGGYVVLPPSLHASGHRYRWVQWREPVEAPDEVLVPESIKPITAADIGQYQPELGDGTGYGLRALGQEIEHVLSAPKGQRNNALNVAALNTGSLVAGGHLNAERAAEELRRAAYTCWSTSGDAPPRGEIDRTIRSGMSEGFTRPRRPKD